MQCFHCAISAAYFGLRLFITPQINRNKLNYVYIYTHIHKFVCSYHLDCQNAMRSIYAESAKELFEICMYVYVAHIHTTRGT